MRRVLAAVAILCIVVITGHDAYTMHQLAAATEQAAQSDGENQKLIRQLSDMRTEHDQDIILLSYGASLLDNSNDKLNEWHATCTNPALHREVCRAEKNRLFFMVQPERPRAQRLPDFHLTPDTIAPFTRGSGGVDPQ